MKQVRQDGFTLLSVMVAILIFSIGLLGLAGLYLRFTATVTQNQNITQIAPWGNSFWGIIQANPAVLTALNAQSPITYTSANVSSAPPQLQSWLNEVLTSANSLQALPNAQVTIKVGADSATGTACAVLTGCSVQLTLVWTQYGNPTSGASGASRSQNFNFQFGL